MLGRASFLLACLALAACGGDPSDLAWSIRIVDPGTRAQARLLITRVTEGGCAGTTELYRGTIDIAESSSAGMPPELAKGTYGFHVEVRSADCNIVASTCVERELPSSQTEVLVEIDGTGGMGAACGAGEECLGNGLCRRTVLPDGSVACETEGEPCGEGSGTCHAMECCFGCWTGSECVEGTTPNACGVGGAMCQACGAGNACRSSACVTVSEQPSFHLSPTSVILRLGDGRYWARGDDATFMQLGPLADDGGTIALRGYTGDLRFSDIASTQVASCGLDADGLLHCWGTNAAGSLGVNDANPMRVEPSPIEVDSLSRWIDVAGGNTHFCAIKSDGGLFCWGSNARGQLGTGSVGGSLPAPTQVAIGGTWQAIATMKGDHTCAIRSDGALFCWGANGEGQLGNGMVGMGPTDAAFDTATPTRVGMDNDWLAVSAGAGHTCGIRGRGGERSLYCWGRNGSGELGIGMSMMPSPTPMRVGDQTAWRTVSAGQFHSCGLLDVSGDVRAYCWGFDGFEALGRSAMGNAYMPVDVESTPRGGWSSIAASWDFTCGVRDGDLLCWGDGREGTLGVGDTMGAAVTLPTEVMLVPAP